MAEDDWASKVARLLLSEFEGRAKFGQLKRRLFQRKLLKGGVTRLLKRLSNNDRFLVFKKGESVKYVSIACQNVSICCGCRKEDCSKFHVCKFFVSGNCQNGSRCRFGHDLGNEANKRVSDSLGLSSFSSEDIRTILFRSHPAVCVNYNTGGCDDDDCPDLHICSRFILKNCAKGTDCELIHSLEMFEDILDTFKLNDLTDVELRKRILVKSHTPRVTEANNGPRSQLTPVSSPNLDQESTSGEEIKENIDDVFRFLFNNFGGRAKFDKFLTGRGHLFQGSDREAIIKWLKNRRNRFALYGNGNDIKYVSVYNKGARVCFKYHDSSSLDCGDEACKYFHICRRFVVGACVSTRCSHSFSSGPNMKVRSDLRLDKLTEGEILSLILCSSPAVCVNHNMSGCCVKDCPDLHVCFKYVFGQCTSGQDCEFGHSVRDSGEHNSYVLKAFQMEKWNEDLLRKLVIVKKGGHRKMPEGARASPEPISQGVQPNRRPARDIPRISTDNFSKHFDLHNAQDADISKYEYICETYTWTGKCPNAGNCPRYHSPDHLPYLWLIQMKKGGEWRVAPSSNLLEQSFCDLCDFETLEFSVDFSEMLAIIKREGENRSAKLRRLSTPSYVEAAPGTPLNFYTQWVWYWRQRDKTYTPFIPGTLQYTLEEKYIKEQYLYYLRIEKLRLVVATHSSPMIQMNQDSLRSTRIVRRPVFIFTDKLEAPTMSPLLLPDVPECTCKVPEHWASVDHFQKFETVLLDDDDPEYTEVERQFFWTMNVNKNRIVAIFRVQNPGLWDKYCSARRAMTPKGQAPENVEERQLFHGTPAVKAARGICANSFDFRRSGENVGTVWGKGAYFSTTARYSHQFTSPNVAASGDPVRFMFLGRVLVGQYTLGHPSYAKPPERDELSMYDSCVNDISDPSIFVIFDLAQSYPEYWIQYITLSDYEPVSRTSVKSKATVNTTATSKPDYYGLSSSASRSDRYSLSSSASSKPDYYGLSSSASRSDRYSLSSSASSKPDYYGLSSSASRSDRDNSSSSEAIKPAYYDLSLSELSKFCHSNSLSPAASNVSSSEVIKSDLCGLSTSTTSISYHDKASSPAPNKSKRDDSSSSAASKPDCHHVASQEISKAENHEMSSSAASKPDCHHVASQEISKAENHEMSSAAGKSDHDDSSSPATSKPEYNGFSASDYCPTSNSASDGSLSADSQSQTQHQSPMPDPPPSRNYCLIS